MSEIENKQVVPDGQRKDKKGSGGGKQKRKSFAEGVYVKCGSIPADKCVARSMEDVIIPVDGIELHDVTGFVMEVVDYYRQMMLQGWDMATDLVRVGRIRDNVTRIIYALAGGLVAYLKASSLYTSGTFVSGVAKLYESCDVLVDEGVIDILNAFMPIERCVQLNVYDVTYRLLTICNNIATWDMYESMKGPHTNAEIITKLQDIALKTTKESNPLIKLIYDVLDSQTMVCENDGQVEVLVKYYPLFKYNVLQKKVEVKVVDFGFLRERTGLMASAKKYYCKLKKLRYAALSRGGVLYASQVLETAEFKMMVRVNSTFLYNPPMQEVHAWYHVNSLGHELYNEVPVVEEIEMKGAEDFVREVASFQSKGGMSLQSEIAGLVKRAQEVRESKEMKPVVNPRMSESSKELVEVKSDFAVGMKLAKIIDTQGVRVKVANNWYVYVDPTVCLCKQRRQLEVVASYAKYRRIKDGAQFVVEKQDVEQFNSYLDNKDRVVWKGASNRSRSHSPK